MFSTLTGPQPVARQKHSGVGGFSVDSFLDHGVPLELAPCLVEAGNFGLAATSWKTYETVARHVAACQRDIGRVLPMPFTVGDVLTFLAWLVDRRAVRAKTVMVYMSGLRMLHFQCGFFDVQLQSQIVRHIVTGLKQRDLVADKTSGREGRLPVTLEVLEKIRLKLQRSNFPLHRRRLIWAVCAMGFSGSFRIHELLARKPEEFDPTTTLLAQDVGLSRFGHQGYKVLKVFLKAPKEARLRHGVAVDLFTTGSYICPVLALEKYLASPSLRLVSKKPLFRRIDGMAYTGACFNADLARLLKGCYQGKITSHSLRAGLATEMARVGYSEADIMAVGRWHSTAYLQYVKGGRLKRMRVAQELAGSILAGRRVH